MLARRQLVEVVIHLESPRLEPGVGSRIAAENHEAAVAQSRRHLRRPHRSDEPLAEHRPAGDAGRASRQPVASFAVGQLPGDGGLRQRVGLQCEVVAPLRHGPVEARGFGDELGTFLGQEQIDVDRGVVPGVVDEVQVGAHLLACQVVGVEEVEAGEHRRQRAVPARGQGRSVAGLPDGTALAGLSDARCEPSPRPACVHVGQHAIQAGAAHRLGVLHAELGAGQRIGVLVLLARPLGHRPAEVVHVLAVGDGPAFRLAEPRGNARDEIALQRVFDVPAGVHVVVLRRAGVAGAHGRPRRVQGPHEVVIRARLPLAVAVRLVGEHPHDHRRVVPEPPHPAGGVAEHVLMPDGVFLGRELVVLVVVEAGELRQDHRAVLVADIGPQRRQRHGVRAKGVHAHLAGLGDEVIELFARDGVPPVPLEDEFRAPQAKGLAVQQVMAVRDRDLAHAEADGDCVQHLLAAPQGDLGGVEVGLLVRPRLEARHRHLDEEVLASEGVRAGREPGRRLAFPHDLPVRPGLDLSDDLQIVQALQAGRRDADLHPAAGEIRQRQHPFHVSGVGEVHPHVIRHLRHPHAEAGRDQGMAAAAPGHARGAADLEHDLVVAGSAGRRRGRSPETARSARSRRPSDR